MYLDFFDFLRPKYKLSQFDYKIRAKSIEDEFIGKPMVPCDRFTKIIVLFNRKTIEMSKIIGLKMPIFPLA